MFMGLHVTGTGNPRGVLLCPCCNVPHRAKPRHVHKVEIVLIRSGHNGNRMVARAKVLNLSGRACTPGGKYQAMKKTKKTHKGHTRQR